MLSPLNQLSSLDGYRRLFADADFWRPYVLEVCRRHNLTPHERVWMGIPGSFPAFIVEKRWLVKFFGRLFGGEQCFLAESAAARLLRERPVMPVPALCAEGELDPPGADWPWPYLVFEFIDGVSVGEVWQQVGAAERLRTARQAGQWARELHRLPLPANGPFAETWQEHVAFLESQRKHCCANHAEWGALPARLIAQIDDYLSPTADLILPGEAPHLIHADLTGDHLLGRLEGMQWNSKAVIDFGDARTGGLFYELVALHLDLFRCDRALLGAVLEAYGYTGPRGEELARCLMSATLMHEFNVLGCPGCSEPIVSANSLHDLARSLWLVE